MYRLFIFLIFFSLMSCESEKKPLSSDNKKISENETSSSVTPNSKTTDPSQDPITVDPELYKSKICYLLDEWILTVLYEYREPYFWYREPGNSLRSIIPRGDISLFGSTPWHILKIETNIESHKKGEYVEWFEYKGEEDENIDILCQPEANDGKCIVKIVYEGLWGEIKYSPSSNSMRYITTEDTKASFYSNKQQFNFDQECHSE